MAEIEPLKAIAQQGLETFSPAMFEAITKHPHWGPYLPYILYRTLGPALPEGAAAAASYWLLAQRFATEHTEAVLRAGLSGQGLALGNALFEAILQGRSGVIFSKSDIASSF